MKEIAIPASIRSEPAAVIRTRVRATHQQWLSLALLAGGTAGTAAVFAFVPAQTSVAADADLATLLRGMAVLKAAFVAGVAVLLLWRFSRPLTARWAGGYLLSVWTMTTATALIWQSSSLAMAAVLFHGAGLAFLILVLRDGSMLPSRLSRLARR